MTRWTKSRLLSEKKYYNTGKADPNNGGSEESSQNQWLGAHTLFHFAEDFQQ